MASELRKRNDRVTVELEAYEIYVEPGDEARFRSDPAAFLRPLIEATGIEINGLVIDESLRDGNAGAGDAGAGPPRPLVYHCESPPQFVSHWITIVLPPS